MGARVVIGVVVVTVVAVASVLMYRTYEYVQHDNQFCLECHLMRDPFERFAQSEHRGLGCKACHRPNIVQRSEMGLAQIVEQPDSIRVHAVVSNRICAECHVEGDPEEWRRIANTAGHRVHLESEDPSLRGLMCVECHSSGVHQFTPIDQTCGQAGCHEDTQIRLGRMGELTIHCATCHDFARPVEEEATTTEVAASLRPEAQECLSCHQMRSMLADLPPDEPHGAECGACHNPHSQETPRQAVQSCATSGCHAQPEGLTPFHRGLDPGVLEDCLACHAAHEFRIHGGGEDCLSCHSDIYQDVPGRRVSSVDRANGPGGETPVRAGAVRLAAGAPRPQPQEARPAALDTLGFWHGQHRGVDCLTCHSTDTEHGALRVTSLRDCRSCHHTEPVVANCDGCHTQAEVRRLVANVERTMDLRIGSLNRPDRSLPFSHAPHLRLDCRECHTGDGAALSAAAVQCSACHAEHHQPDTECMACHHPPARGAHDLAVHGGCGGSGCHTAAPETVSRVPRTRSFCLVCHQDLTDHRPGRNCEECHTLPQPSSSATGDASAPGPRRADEP